jgi:hypothetical protein
VPLSERERQKRKCLDARGRSRQVRVVQHDAGATRSNDLARRCDEMTTAFRFANVSGRVHHALSAREARANPLTSSGLKSAHRTRTLKPDGAFPDTQSSEGCCAGRRAQAQPSTASAFKIVPIAYRRTSGQHLGGWRTQSRRIRWQSRWQKPCPVRRVLINPCGGEGDWRFA